MELIFYQHEKHLYGNVCQRQTDKCHSARSRAAAELAYKFNMVDKDKYIEIERERLREIANYCPYTHGNAVYVARGILAMVYGPALKFYNDCELPPQHVDKSSARKMQSPTMQDIQPKGNAAITPVIARNEAISLYPNPNNGNFTIRFIDYNIQSKLRIEIMDFTGKIIDEKYTSERLFKYSGKLSGGIYLCKVYDGVKEVFKTKFVVFN